MTPQQHGYLALYLVLVLGLAYPLGHYMAAVFEGRRTWAHVALQPIERVIYRVAGIDPAAEHNWKTYGVAFLAFNALGFVALYVLLRAQGYLPLNPADVSGMSPHLAFNSAVSFTTNTNWQAYSGEVAASHLAQMAGFAYQNFVSAAVGIAVLLAVIRGLTRFSTDELGNFWVDTTRCVLYVLLPLSLVLSVFLVSQGVVQTFDASAEVTTLEGATQDIALGPVASQVAIKQLGTNGGGFFGTNSAHPLENPTPWSNLAEAVAILLIPAALVFMFGRMARRMRHAVVLLVVMTVLFVIAADVATLAEQRGTAVLDDARVLAESGDEQSGGNMEGKEVRFGIGESALWAVATTAASNGSVNSMHDSYTPVGGLMPMAMMSTGEVIFGGVGSGLYGMLMYVLLAVFIAGLMVGRTPEYLGKKVEAREMKAVMVAFLGFSLVLLVSVAIGAATDRGVQHVHNAGPHGFSEILYAFASGSANNGSAFAGLAVNNPFYDTLIGVGILVGRYLFVVAALVIAGSMVQKKLVASGPGTLPLDGPLFGILLTAVILILGLLTFFPAFALGPIVEQFAMNDGGTY